MDLCPSHLHTTSHCCLTVYLFFTLRPWIFTPIFTLRQPSFPSVNPTMALSTGKPAAQCAVPPASASCYNTSRHLFTTSLRGLKSQSSLATQGPCVFTTLVHSSMVVLFCLWGPLKLTFTLKTSSNVNFGEAFSDFTAKVQFSCCQFCTQDI